jgi:hypothetical protein
MKSPLRFFALSVGLTLGLVHPAAAFAADPECEVNVNTTLTEAGRKVAPPSREHPAYYFPVVAGWREEGAVVAGEHAPPRAMVTKQLAKTLADQGYLVVGAKTPAPSLLLVFHWGYLNPQIDDLGSVDSPQKIFFNQKEMLALVGGTTLNHLDLEFEREAVMQGAEEDRYFVLVTAYDFADAQQKKKTVLWRARMSTPSAGLTMEEVVAALVKSGGPLFGRETVRPQWINAPVAKLGHVEIGTPTVVPDAPGAKTAPEKK